MLNMDDVKTPGFRLVSDAFKKYCGVNCYEVSLREWEYCGAVLWCGILQDTRPMVEVVDVGCGGSLLSEFLAKLGYNVAACDTAGAAAGMQRDKAHNVSIERADMCMTALKYESNSFDYVFCISAIEHVNAGRFAIPGMAFDEGDGLALKELERILKPGGILILTTDISYKYVPPPGLWPTGSHRIYDEETLLDRIRKNTALVSPHSINLDFPWETVKEVQPRGYDYTECLLKLTKLS